MKRWFLRIFGIICCLTLCAEWITNDKPIILVQKNHIFFPAYQQYCEQDFGGVSQKPMLHYKKNEGLWPIFQ